MFLFFKTGQKNRYSMRAFKKLPQQKTAFRLSFRLQAKRCMLIFGYLPALFCRKRAENGVTVEGIVRKAGDFLDRLTDADAETG